ncbi:hypothetical protein [Pseudonocardia phyllosphaerae]|uniref:hypothetical protein n=1 Tax=Pseudonocardia phyllosphaerae TaxID=3390502 RepID=UPI003979B30F
MGREGLQGLAGLIAVTLGLIPLGQLVFTGRIGSIWGALLGGQPSLPWLGPVIVLVLAVAAIAGLEVQRRRTG